MSSTYEAGGSGGKFRKRPFRRPPATPYDRPPSALRVGTRGPAEAADGASLRSRLVGTASRLITDGASRIFSSFFHRRLAAPPAPPEENHQFREDVPEVTGINPSPERHEESCGGDKYTKDSDVNSSDTVGISEVEQLLKQKTYTRAEFDRLTKLLLSRTVESGAIEPVINIQDEDAPVLENRVEAPVLHENISTDITVAKDDLASPAELAKAYMGSIPSKVTSSSLILRSQVFHEDKIGSTNVPFVLNPLTRSAVPRSVIQISGSPKLSENTYQTPKPRGRSANSPLTSSPYFKARPTANVEGTGLAVVDYTGPSSSRLPPTNLTHLGGRQALKRRSSVFDTEGDSFGPIRRIRQKYYSTPPSRIHHSILSNKVGYKGSSLKMPHNVELKHYNRSLLETENKENGIGSTSTTVPPKSTETAMKIFQQLDILVSPSKEKSSEPKSVAKDKAPSNLTHNVSGGWSPKNMEDNNSGLKNSQSEKQYRVEENGPSQSAFPGGLLTPESCSDQNTAAPPTNANPVTKSVASATFPPRQTTSFRMSAHKDLMVSDHENHNDADASGSLSTKYAPETTKLKQSSTNSVTASPEKYLTSSSSLPGSSSLSLKDAGMNDSGRLGFSGKDTGFSFSVTSGPSTQSQQPPTPTMSGLSPDIPALQKIQAVTTAFEFGSKAAPTSAPIIASVGNTASQKVDARDATMTTAVEDTSSGKMFKPSNISGNSVFSGISMKNSSGIFSFASSSATTTTRSNGSLFPASASSPPSADPAVTHSDTRASSPLFTTSSTTPTTSMSSPSIPSSAPIFSTVTTFEFGSSMSTNTANTGTTASLAPSSVSPSMGSIFKFSASSQPTTSSFTDAAKAQSAAAAAGSTQSTQSGPSPSQFGSFAPSSALGLSKPSSGFGTSPFVFGASATETSAVSSNPGTVSSAVPAAATSLFSSSSSSQPFTSSVFGFTAGLSSSSPSTGSLFGNSSSASGSSSLPLSLSAEPVFSFTSAIPTTSPAAPVFGFGAGSPGNDKMNVENTETNAVNQTAASTASLFGQPSALPTTPTFVFGSGTQNPAATPSQPFQAGFAPGGGFSVGTGGGDKVGRRFIKIKRDKKPPQKLEIRAFFVLPCCGWRSMYVMVYERVLGGHRHATKTY